MGDRVFVRGLEVTCMIGVADWERRTSQKLCVDLDLFGDYSAAGRADDLSRAIDYDAVCRRVAALAASARFALVEALAERIAGDLFAAYPVLVGLRVRVTKARAVADAEAVGVEIERHREPA